MRIFWGFAIGMIIAFLCLLGVEAIGQSLFPVPHGIDPLDPAGQARRIEAMSASARAVVPVGWFVASLVGGWVGNRIAGRALPGWAISLIILGAGVFNMFGYPHPIAMWIAAIVLPLLAACLAQWVAKVPV